MNRNLILGGIVATVLAVATVLIVLEQPKRLPVETIYDVPETMLEIQAAIRAANLGGTYYRVLPTGSMEPFITGGDFVVVCRIDYQDIKEGLICNYQARWLPPTSPTTIHWAAKKLGDEWIMDGQNNAHYEKHPSQLMGSHEFRGVVKLILTSRQQPK